jgi:hypothetical protein
LHEANVRSLRLRCAFTHVWTIKVDREQDVGSPNRPVSSSALRARSKSASFMAGSKGQIDPGKYYQISAATASSEASEPS